MSNTTKNNGFGVKTVSKTLLAPPALHLGCGQATVMAVEWAFDDSFVVSADENGNIRAPASSRATEESISKFSRRSFDLAQHQRVEFPCKNVRI